MGDGDAAVFFDVGEEAVRRQALFFTGAEDLPLAARVVDVLVAKVVPHLVGGPLVGQQGGELAVPVELVAGGAHVLPLRLGDDVGEAVVVGQGGEVQL